MAAVNPLTDGATDEGTFAVTFLVVLAINVLPLYVESTTDIVALVLFGTHELYIVVLKEFVPFARLIVCFTVDPILSSTL
jgi:hypothetical protein